MLDLAEFARKQGDVARAAELLEEELALAWGEQACSLWETAR